MDDPDDYPDDRLDSDEPPLEDLELPEPDELKIPDRRILTPNRPDDEPDPEDSEPDEPDLDKLKPEELDPDAPKLDETDPEEPNRPESDELD